MVAEVGDGREAVREAIALKPDVAILDVAMPLLNGIDAAQQIVRRVPETRILMLSMHADEAYVMRAVQAGATGYMLKDAAGKELLTAIESVAAGQAVSSVRRSSVCCRTIRRTRRRQASPIAMTRCRRGNGKCFS